MEENKEIMEPTEAPANGKMFTQEEVNGLIKDRLDRAEKKWQEKYANYFSADDVNVKTEDLNKQVAELSNTLKSANEKAEADANTISELQKRVQNYETAAVKSRIAREFGIEELADRLSGDTEDAIREDAKALADRIGKRMITAPLRNAESTTETDGVLAAFKALNPNIKI